MVGEANHVIDIVGNVLVMAIGMSGDPKIRVSPAGGVTHAM